MAGADELKLDFAYRYPFSTEARELISSVNTSKLEEKYVTAGLLRVNEAISRQKIEFIKTPLTELKYTYLMSYVYARMLISAAGDRYAIARYASAEANRAADALFVDSAENVAKVAKELGLGIKEKDGSYLIRFEEFSAIRRGDEALALANQQLAGGMVHMSKERMVKLLGYAIEREIIKRLPIERKALPRGISEMAKGIKLEEKRAIAAETSGSYAWIEQLLKTPIPDVRHRTVNLILAPYLTNVRKLDEDAASKIIIEYIERCKQMNPNTRINDSYIRYQCHYSKSRGLRPLSASRARDLLADVIEFG